MEPSPLLKAHDHARAAAVATRQASDTTIAISEHTQAAGEFASAASNTSSVEALRMLKLLEDHHRRLAELLNLPAPQQQQQQQQQQNSAQHAGDDDATNPSDETKAGGDGATTDDGGKAAAADARAKTAQPTPHQQKQPTPHRRLASREMSSSIASNLASARGIRSSRYRGQPLTPSVSNDQAPGNIDSRSRRYGSEGKMHNIMESQQQSPGKPTWVPPMPSTSPPPHGKPSSSSSSSRRVPPPTDSNTKPADDGGYTKFYNTFGSLMNRISAPLAFAGLPLVQEESIAESEESASAEQQQRVRQPSPGKSRKTQAISPPQSRSSAAAHDADLSKIYSRATMRALENEGYGASESFYVVPTSGHTISYANILSYAEKEKRRLGGGTKPTGSGSASVLSTMREGPEDDQDDFVDAREMPAALSAGAQRRVGRARTDRELSNTIEELYTENKSLKDMLDKLTKRLHTFEASAQKMSESFSLMRPGSPVRTHGGSAGGSSSKAEVLEAELASMKKYVDRLERDNKKMAKTLERYREQWETLKAGAKARREAQGGGESGEEARTTAS